MLTQETLPKAAKALPDEAQRLFVDAYNRDFAWRCSEAHAEKAAWRAVRLRFEETEDGWHPRKEPLAAGAA